MTNKCHPSKNTYMYNMTQRDFNFVYRNRNWRWSWQSYV